MITMIAPFFSLARVLLAAGLLCLVAGTVAAEKSKVVFISGKPSHGPMAHEHRAGNLLLAKALNEADLGIESVVLPKNGYPEDPAVLEDAATIVIFCTGHRGHLLNPHLEAFDSLMKRGTGVVMIHWATEAEIGMPAKKFLEWMGGFCDLNWSVNPHWKPDFQSFPDHPVANGLVPFSVDDEWYYHMRFVGDLEGVTPILSAVPPPETLKRPDGPRSGNPAVRKAVAAGESQHVAWAYERPGDQGRGFGFTGAHNHVSWQDDNFRKVVLNAILWTAGVEVPKNGVPSSRPTDEEIRANLDDKKARKKPAPTKPVSKAPNTDALELDDVRRGNVQQMDRRVSLEMLADLLVDTPDAARRASLLRGMLLGLEGQREVAPPKAWKSLGPELAASQSPELKNLGRQLGQVFGDEKATREALATLEDGKAILEDRQKALASLLTQQRKELLPLLEALLSEEALRIAAIRGYATFDDPRAASLLLDRYEAMDDEARRAIVETLATRKRYAEALFAAVKAERIPREAVPAYVARSLDSVLQGRFSAAFGERKLAGDKETLIAKYKELATPEALAEADAAQGRLIYQRTCLACHQMYGEGGIVGPDLTGSNRADLNYLLLNILDPSGDIPDAYRMVMITTKNGQLMTGSVTEEDDQRVVLSMIGQQSVVAKSDIAKRETAPVSMMPEGLLQTLKPEEVLDLFKYMQTKRQVDLPE